MKINLRMPLLSQAEVCVALQCMRTRKRSPSRPWEHIRAPEKIRVKPPSVVCAVPPPHLRAGDSQRRDPAMGDAQYDDQGYYDESGNYVYWEQVGYYDDNGDFQYYDFSQQAEAGMRRISSALSAPLLAL